MNLSDIKDVRLKRELRKTALFSTGYGKPMSVEEIKELWYKLEEFKRREGLNKPLSKIVDSFLEHSKDIGKVIKEATIFKEAPFKNPTQESFMFANPATREIAKKWKKEHGDAPGWKSYVKKRGKKRKVSKN